VELLEALRREHAIIEPVVSALVGYAEARARGEGDPADVSRFVRFFESFAGRFHHGREEGVLFPALVEHTEVSADRGPIAALLADHVELGALVADWSTRDGAPLLESVKRYASQLLHHIDAENTVLFPECESRFRRVSLLELDDREPDDEERLARDDAAKLVERYGAKPFIDASRGEGCVCCPAFGVRCDGVEREWSSDAEWEDMLDRVGGGD
jgi:hemerythrin-like domain-containing protein